MTDEFISTIKETVETTIKTTVNGKIDRLTVDFNRGIEELHNRLDEQDQKIAPAIETIQTLQSGRKFILWAIPVFAFVGGLIAFVQQFIDKKP